MVGVDFTVPVITPVIAPVIITFNPHITEVITVVTGYLQPSAVPSTVAMGTVTEQGTTGTQDIPGKCTAGKILFSYVACFRKCYTNKDLSYAKNQYNRTSPEFLFDNKIFVIV